MPRKKTTDRDNGPFGTDWMVLATVLLALAGTTLAVMLTGTEAVTLAMSPAPYGQ